MFTAEELYAMNNHHLKPTRVVRKAILAFVCGGLHANVAVRSGCYEEAVGDLFAPT